MRDDFDGQNVSFLLIFKDFLLVILQFIWYNELLKLLSVTIYFFM
mgnify:CR=1 FL=1